MTPNGGVRSELIELSDGTVEIVEYDAQGQVVARTYGHVQPADDQAHVELRSEDAKASGTPSPGTWDIYVMDPVTDDLVLAETLEQFDVFHALVGLSPAEKHQRYLQLMKLPSFAAAPAQIRAGVHQWIKDHAG